MTASKKVATAVLRNAFRALTMKYSILVAVLFVSAGAGCDRTPSDGRGLLERLSNRGGPDEFAVVPQKPLVPPTDFSSLPAPTPGAGNRADLTPGSDVILAMTGTIPRDPGVAAGDAALLAAIWARAGTAPDDGFNFFGLFGGRSDVLDAQAELERLRALGVRTPAAPPAN